MRSNPNKSPRTWLKIAGMLLLAGLVLSGCGPGEEELQAIGTRMAYEIFATLTASVPTRTHTPVPTSTPLSTPTPPFDALINVPVLKVYAEPVITDDAIYEYTGQDHLGIIGRNRDCSWVQVLTPLGDTGWVNTQLNRITLITPCESLAHGYARPRNGAIIFNNFQKNGYGQLKVDNGQEQDGYVILTDLENNPLLGSYIHAGEEYTILDIPDGTYLVYFTSGDVWDLVVEQFSENVTYIKFQDSMEFQTISTSYILWSITLHPVEGGGASTEQLEPAEFPVP